MFVMHSIQPFPVEIYDSWLPYILKEMSAISTNTTHEMSLPDRSLKQVRESLFVHFLCGVLSLTQSIF